jgi:hypothetical protein
MSTNLDPGGRGPGYLQECRIRKICSNFGGQTVNELLMVVVVVVQCLLCSFWRSLVKHRVYFLESLFKFEKAKLRTWLLVALVVSEEVLHPVI